MVLSPKGKVLMQNVYNKGSSSRKTHCEEDYAADVDDVSAFDEGSDEDEDDDDSEVEPPELYEDVENVDDEDIFRGPPKKESQPHEAENMQREQTQNQQVPVDDNWFTDVEEGDELQSLGSSSDENSKPKWPDFNELTDMGNPQLKLGMIFASP